MRNKRVQPVLRGLLAHARYEVLPTPSIAERVCAAVPTTVPITVTASPRKPLEATLELTERLAAAGYQAVPHLAARMISGRSELAEICDRLVAAGVRTVFVPAGDADPPAGEYDAALGVLRDLAALGGPFPEVGVTGYPESHPALHDDVTIQAMWDKRHYATHLVSNLTFDPGLLTAWVRRLRARGVGLPMLVGLPGPVERTKLLSMAAKIGVGESTRFLGKHRRTFARIAAPGGYDPMRFLRRCARTFADPAMGVTGLHLFTFNQVEETERWRREQLAGAGAVPEPA